MGDNAVYGLGSFAFLASIGNVCHDTLEPMNPSSLKSLRFLRSVKRV